MILLVRVNALAPKDQQTVIAVEPRHFGEQGIADDFDPKKVKRPKSAKGAELVFYVNSTMVRYFLADETDFYQDLAESLTAAEAEKQR